MISVRMGGRVDGWIMLLWGKMSRTWGFYLCEWMISVWMGGSCGG